jgi:SAM-dependent methyltransferase
MFDERLLRCVECYGALNAGLTCVQCSAAYPRASSGAPIIMTPADRERFGVLLRAEGGTQMQATYERRRSRAWSRKLYPPEPVYVNPTAPPMPAPRPGAHLWIGGAGLDLPGFINMDVAPVAGVDVVANASRLPFESKSFDRIACLALLEHVPDPEQVVGEMFRALKPGGEAQIVAPFCHPYHAFPADYSRFSRERLAGLFSGFADVEIGIRTGPTVTMLTFLIYYMKIFLPVHGGVPARRAFNRLVCGGVGWAIWPLKYLDVWLNALPGAHVLANHFYVVARR